MDKEYTAKYLETLIAGKAAVLDRTSQQEVEAYNTLMKRYEEIMLMDAKTPKEVSEKGKIGLDEQMALFKKHNPGFEKSIPKGALKVGKAIDTKEGFDLDIHTMRDKLASKELK